MLPIDDSLTAAVHAYIDSHLEQGELFRRWTYFNPIEVAPKLTFAAVVQGIVEIIGAILSEGSTGFSWSTDKKFEIGLIVLTDRRFLYANAVVNRVVNRSGGKTVILPMADTDEWQSLPVSDIHSAEYESGFVKGTLTVRLIDMSELAFFFRFPRPGQIAKEIAEMINNERVDR